MPESTALLFALTSSHPSLSLEDFNNWYDTRHAPSRAACPGVHSVCRFEAVDRVSEEKERAIQNSNGAMTAHKESHWHWVAMYELESEGALQTEAYKKAREDDGDDESKMFDFLSRRVYKVLSDRRREDYTEHISTHTGKNSRFIAMVSLEPDADSDITEEEFIDWYEKEHIDLLSKCPGWLRSSRWELLDARDPRNWEQTQSGIAKFLALHEVEDADAVYASAELQEAVATPWREKIMEHRNKKTEEQRLLTLWKQF